MNNEPPTAPQPLSVDGFQPRLTPPRATSAPTARPVKRVYSRPQQARRQRSWLKNIQLSLLLMAGTLGGFFADNVVLGLGLLAIYAVAAWITHIPSRTTFTLALLLLVAISVMLLLRPNITLIQNFATYTFVLLLVGVITLGREAKMPKRMPRKYKR